MTKEKYEMAEKLEGVAQMAENVKTALDRAKNKLHEPFEMDAGLRALDNASEEMGKLYDALIGIAGDWFADIMVGEIMEELKK